ncbi:MAG: UxaA family hydrolase, partial [Desulfobacterales bacterium]|nr:UxaA family hydrolase [Desulfobacterales bacterium]
MNFEGYRRADGRAGTRNTVLVIPSVGCSLETARCIAQGIKGVVYLPNILGCGQMGEDRQTVKRTLTGFGLNPNVFAVVIVGLGCEELSAGSIAEVIRQSGKRVEELVIQEVGGTRKTIVKGRGMVKEMLADASKVRREPIPLDELILGTECGGSDFTSGLSSNPAVGSACDILMSKGGTVILSETPELIGAEHLLARRARTRKVARQLLDAVAWWEKRAIEAGQDIRQGNPSPGNIAGGITTLEEKSLGCIYKAGKASLQEVIPYGANPNKKGLVFMDTPAHDIEQLTGMVAGGAQIILFTTGRGTPIGSPIAPVIKITGNRNTYLGMKAHIDIVV